MSETPEIRTERLWLRPCRESDLEGGGCDHADLRVVEYLPGPLIRADSDALVGS